MQMKMLSDNSSILVFIIKKSAPRNTPYPWSLLRNIIPFALIFPDKTH